VNAEPAVYVCITLLGISAQHNIKTDLKELLEPMLAMGLSSTLTIALKELAVAVPALKKDISEGEGNKSVVSFSITLLMCYILGLLRMLSQVLNNRNTTITIPMSGPNSALSLSLVPTALEPQNITNVVLALRTLGSFNFEGQ